MKVLVDTNVLLRLAHAAHPQHALAAASLKVLQRNGGQLCIVPQVVYEYWVVCTRPTENNGLGMSAEEARKTLSGVRRLFALFRDERAIFQEWERLVHEYEIRGKAAHDARIVAAMKRHAINQLLTFNVADFARYSDITIHAADKFMV